MTEHEREIRRIVAAQVDGWNRGDAAAWGADCDPAVEFTNILGMRWDTRDGNVTRHAEMFRGPFAGSTLAVEIERLHFPAPDAAVVALLTTLTGFRGLPPGIRATAEGRLVTRMLEVMTLHDGHWRSWPATTRRWRLRLRRATPRFARGRSFAEHRCVPRHSCPKSRAAPTACAAPAPTLCCTRPPPTPSSPPMTDQTTAAAHA